MYPSQVDPKCHSNYVCTKSKVVPTVTEMSSFISERYPSCKSPYFTSIWRVALLLTL